MADPMGLSPLWGMREYESMGIISFSRSLGEVLKHGTLEFIIYQFLRPGLPTKHGSAKKVTKRKAFFGNQISKS